MLLKRANERDSTFVLNEMPNKITQKTFSPAIYWINGKCAIASCISCEQPRCMKYTHDELECGFISGFSADPSDGVCPGNAIEWDHSQNRPVIKNALCFGCGICAHRCPLKAIYIDENAGKARVSVNYNIITSVSLTNSNCDLQKSQIQRVTEIPCDSAPPIQENETFFSRLYESISGFDGRTNSQGMLVRNLLIELGNSCALRRQGDNHCRADAIFQNSVCKGVIEIEYGQDTLEASRCILDDIATMHTHYSFFKEHNTPVVVCLSLPNKRQGYYQVIKDVKSVLKIKVQTVSIGALLLLMWNDKPFNFANGVLYVDFDHLSIREAIEREIGKKINVSSGYLGLLEPNK